MENKYYSCYKEIVNVDFNLNKYMIEHVMKTDTLITQLIKINNDILKEYIEALRKRLVTEVSNYTIDTNSINFEENSIELSYLNKDIKLKDLIINYLAKRIGLPENSKITSELIEFPNLLMFKTYHALSYYRVKALTDVLGKEEGLKLYTKVLNLFVKEWYKDEEINPNQTVRSRNERAVKNWCKYGVGNFTFTFIDNDQVIYRFDKCVTHETLIEFNDPDIAYASSCLIGDIEEWNKKDVIHLRRTQTLHHADFCDELYWDSRVHTTPPKQPTLEFTKNIEKKK
ncbi:MAG: hypothetical protein FK733_14830 [Asgard group archaeon]|nr:hypothetical protein [Asgard group archaeon]